MKRNAYFSPPANPISMAPIYPQPVTESLQPAMPVTGHDQFLAQQPFDFRALQQQQQPQFQNHFQGSAPYVTTRPYLPQQQMTPEMMMTNNGWQSQVIRQQQHLGQNAPAAMIVQNLSEAQAQPKPGRKRKMPKECTILATALPEQNVRRLPEGLDFSPAHSLIVQSVKGYLAKPKKPGQFNEVCFGDAKSEHECILGPVEALFEKVHPDSWPALKAMIVAANNAGIQRAPHQQPTGCIWMRAKLKKGVLPETDPMDMGRNDLQRTNKSGRIHGVELQNACLLFMVVRHEPCGVTFGIDFRDPGSLSKNDQCKAETAMPLYKGERVFCANPYHVDTPEIRDKKAEEERLIAAAALVANSSSVVVVRPALLPGIVDHQVDSLASNFTSNCLIVPMPANMATSDVPPMINLKSEKQSHLFYNVRQFYFALQSQSSLKDDLRWIVADLTRLGIRNDDFSRLIIMVNCVEVHLLETPYDHSCPCQTGSWKNGNSSRYHFLFDFLVRIGWLDPISREEKARNNLLEICSEGRAVDFHGFVYCVNTYKLNPSGLCLKSLRAVTGYPELPDPTQCARCNQRFSRDSAHVMANLLLLLGLTSEEELRAFSSCNCTYMQNNEPAGVPIRARDLLDFFVFSGRFIVYGPSKLPPNYWQHSRSAEVTVQCQQMGFFTPDQLATDQRCFVFCRRRINTQGNPNAMYFGTKSQVYVGVTTFSASKFDHWYFVPRFWQQCFMAIGQPPAVLHPAVDEHSLNTPHCTKNTTN